MHVLESQNLTIPNESPEIIVPSLLNKNWFNYRPGGEKRYHTNPRTPTVQTNVRSPRILLVPILSIIRPVATSHFRRLLSEQPVTNQESLHSSSSSSSLNSATLGSKSFFVLLFGGPHAILSIRHFTLSKRRKWVKVSFAVERIRTVPSSHPSAREEDDGLGAMDHMDPP